MTRGKALIRGGDRYLTRIEVNGHAIIADEPAQHGGGDVGPSPYDLVLAGLGACTAITLRMYADRKNWSLDQLEVQLDLIADTSGDRHIRRVLVPTGLDADQAARLLEISEKTPVTLTLKEGIAIRTTISGIK